MNNKKKINKYSAAALKEFENVILEKIEVANNELKILKNSLSRKEDTGTDSTMVTSKILEDGADTIEKENLSRLASRQQKFIHNLENALIRIKNNTYGVCRETGDLIPKERLLAVPHATLSIKAKLNGET